MKLRENVAQVRHSDVSPSTMRLARTNFQLAGRSWLHLARGAWIAFALAVLVLLTSFICT
ncbi:MAG TPA: hypothetical protein VIZ18_18225 [Ktedonobacteraceae bacterium]